MDSTGSQNRPIWFDLWRDGRPDSAYRVLYAGKRRNGRRCHRRRTRSAHRRADLDRPDRDLRRRRRSSPRTRRCPCCTRSTRSPSARSAPGGSPRPAAEPLTGGDTGGDSPCHLAVTSDGQHLISTNYASGSISVHRIDPTGAIGARTDLLVHDGHGPDPERQVSAHAHMISIDPRGGPAHVVDLGTDAIYPYVLDAGRLVPSGPRVHVRAGTGPRHLARHPDGRRVYVVGELDPTITVFEVDGHGWHERHRVPSSARDGLRLPSEIVVRADGRFLYVANRGVDTVRLRARRSALDGAAPALVDEVDCAGRVAAAPRDRRRASLRRQRAIAFDRGLRRRRGRPGSCRRPVTRAPRRAPPVSCPRPRPC